jgi:hypothetical protein
MALVGEKPLIAWTLMGESGGVRGGGRVRCFIHR